MQIHEKESLALRDFSPVLLLGHSDATPLVVILESLPPLDRQETTDDYSRYGDAFSDISTEDFDTAGGEGVI